MFARTKRLTLRPGWPEDAATLAGTIAHEAVAMRLARLPWPYAVGDAAAFLAVPRGAEEPRFLIYAHEGGAPTMIGGMGLNALGGGVYELGYWLTPSAWGRGYATEAGRVVIEMARHALPVRRIEASHHLGNPASRRVLAKLGFREVRREPRYSLAQDAMVDCAVMALELDTSTLRHWRPDSLSPLAGRGEASVAKRGRGALRETSLAPACHTAPLPNPLP